jgi:hypothetical protein
VRREILGQLEGATDGDALLAALAWFAAPPLDEDEERGAERRAVLLLAAGGDPHRALDLEGRAVTALAGELDSPTRRAALAAGLAALQAESEGLPAVSEALSRLIGDAELAWRAFTAGLLGAELAD